MTRSQSGRYGNSGTDIRVTATSNRRSTIRQRQGAEGGTRGLSAFSGIVCSMFINGRSHTHPAELYLTVKIEIG